MTHLRPTLRWLASFAISCALAASAFAQEVGDDVVAKADQVALHPDKGPPVLLVKGEILSLVKVERDRYRARLTSGMKGPVEGWINRSDVLALATALEIVNDELKQKPTAAGYAVRAAMWEAQHNHDRAIADGDEAIRLDPKRAQAFFTRGTARFLKRDYDPALSDFNEAIRLEPAFAAAYIRRASTWRYKHQYQKALADCDRAFEINPSFSAVHTMRAAVWGSQKQYGLAIFECNEAIRLDPNFASAYNGRGYAWDLKGEFAKAIADYDQALRIAPRAVQTYLNRATVYRELADWDRSLADYDTAIRIAPKEFPPLAARAWLRATCPDARYRDGKKSLKDAKQACELSGWKDIACLSALAGAYAENGDFLNAVRWQQKAVDLVPENEPQERAALQYPLTFYKSQQPFREKPPGE
jgi:tetratricopeptide (TPR) repeat protein